MNWPVLTSSYNWFTPVKSYPGTGVLLGMYVNNENGSKIQY